MNRTLLVSAAGVLLLLAVCFYGWRWLFSGPSRESPKVLAQTALTAGAPEVQQQAARRLAPMGWQAIEPMAEVLVQSKDPVVRATMIQGLSMAQDTDHMPVFLDSLDDDNVLVRARAAGAVERLLQIEAVRPTGERMYDAAAPRADRAAAVRIYRQEWEKVRISPGWRHFVEKLQRERQQQQQ